MWIPGQPELQSENLGQTNQLSRKSVICEYICSGRILKEIWDFEDTAKDVYPEECGGFSWQLLRSGGNCVSPRIRCPLQCHCFILHALLDHLPHPLGEFLVSPWALLITSPSQVRTGARDHFPRDNFTGDSRSWIQCVLTRICALVTLCSSIKVVISHEQRSKEPILWS